MKPNRLLSYVIVALAGMSAGLFLSTLDCAHVPSRIGWPSSEKPHPRSITP